MSAGYWKIQVAARHMELKKDTYSKHPHKRTHDFGGQADWVLTYRVLSDKSASKCSLNVLKFLFSNIIQNMLLEV